jgi:hypothetical protein
MCYQELFPIMFMSTERKNDLVRSSLIETQRKVNFINETLRFTGIQSSFGYDLHYVPFT